MFIAMLALLPAAGCTPRYVLRLSNPDQASSVALFEGLDPTTEDDDRQTVIYEPDRIAKVAAFFKSKEDEFYRMEEDSPLLPHCTIRFHKDQDVTDRFWLDPTHLYMKTPDNHYFACKITQRESSDLVKIFRSAEKSDSTE
jgi:hypothetical protein